MSTGALAAPDVAADDSPVVDEALLDKTGLDDPAPPAHRWRPACDVMADAGPAPVVEGVLWAGCVTTLVGESSAGKSFLALDLAASISADLPWHGRHVRHGSVVYAGFEGHPGIRLRALRDVGGHHLDHVYVIAAGDPISPRIDRDRVELPSRGESELAADLDSLSAALRARDKPPIRLLIVDTLRASLAGSEDSSECVSAYLRSVRRAMAYAPEAATLIVHHAGWQDGGDTARKRERGSSSLRGNVDGVLYLETEAYDSGDAVARLKVTVLKARDAEPLPPLRLVRRRVEIPGERDRWGRPVTSCLIGSDRRSEADVRAERKAEQDAADDASDRQVLRVLVGRPDLTSQAAIRREVGLSLSAVSMALDRLASRGWIRTPQSQRRPYVVLPAGFEALRVMEPPA